MLIKQGLFDMLLSLLKTLFAASSQVDLEPDLAQFLTVDAADWSWDQEAEAEDLRETHASVEHDYGPEGMLTEMQAQGILIGVNICLFHPF